MATQQVKSVKVTLVRSLNRRTEKVAATVRGLGLRRINHSRVVPLTPENQGMINKVSYLLAIEEAV
jgi:large subunit ribosomal protein L30